MFRTGAIAWSALVCFALLFVPVIDGGDKFGWLRLWQVYWMAWMGITSGATALLLAGVIGLLILAVHLLVSLAGGALLAWGAARWLRWITSGRSPSAPSTPR